MNREQRVSLVAEGSNFLQLLIFYARKHTRTHTHDDWIRKGGDKVIEHERYSIQMWKRFGNEFSRPSMNYENVCRLRVSKEERDMLWRRRSG